MTEQDDPIESYLDQLLLSAPGGPRQVRRTLAEAEDHLMESARAGLEQGLSPEQARTEAVRRFGPAKSVVDQRPLASWLRPPRSVRRQLVLSATLLCGWAGLAAGLAGAIALVIRAIWGPGAIATGFPSGSYGSADCSRWLAEYPNAGSCQAAMVSDHADDFLRNAGLALIVGVLALTARAVLHRAWRRPGRPALDAVIAAGLALAATVICAADAFDAVTVTRGHGAGQPIALAVAAGLATLALAGRAKQTAGRPLMSQRPA